MKSYSKPKKVKHPRYNYIVYYTNGEGKRVSKFFKTLIDADTFSSQGNIQVENAGLTVATLPEAARREYIDAAKILKPYGITVIDAIREYVDVREKLAPYKKGLPDAVKLVKKYSEAVKESISIFDAYGEYMDSLQAQGLSTRHIDSQEHRLKRFIDFVGESTLVMLIDAKKIEKWLFSLKSCEFIEDKTADVRDDGSRPKVMQEGKDSLSAKTKNNYRTALLGFFNYCKRKGYIQANPIESIAKIKEPPKEPEIFTVDEIRGILNITQAGGDIRVYVAIAAFAGLRLAELERLTWNKIDLTDKTITLDAAIVKTAQRRIVKISDNLVQWLLPYSLKTNTTEKVLDGNFQNRFDAFKERNGIIWKHNALRHSAASYLFALTGNEATTAAQTGHDIKVFRTYYKGLVKEKDAKRYFSILPPEAKEPLTESIKEIRKHKRAI